MKKGAWLLVALILITLYVLSSIPGLRVLPVLSAINAGMVRLDLTIVRLAEWLTSQVPLNLKELRHIDRATGDFLAYASENPIIIEFLVRKLAHIFIFFIITIVLFFLLQQYIRSSALAVVCTFLGGSVIAGLDEYRQSFVDGRVGSTVDVFINLIGISLATGLIIFSLFLTWPGRQSFLHRESRKRSMEEAAKQEAMAEDEPAPTDPSGPPVEGEGD